MRFRIGPLPDDPGFRPEQGGWRKLKEPSFGLLLLLAFPTSALTAAGVLFVWVLLVRVRGLYGPVQVVIAPWTLLGAFAALVALVVAHELAHAVVLPRGGLTSATTLGFWPQTVTPYVSYQGELSRNRFLLVGLMPLLLWSAAPLVIGLLFAWIPLWMVLLSTVNALVSSADLIGAVLLLSQTPRSAVVRNKGLATWWRVPV